MQLLLHQLSDGREDRFLALESKRGDLSWKIVAATGAFRQNISGLRSLAVGVWDFDQRNERVAEWKSCNNGAFGHNIGGQQKEALQVRENPESALYLLAGWEDERLPLPKPCVFPVSGTPSIITVAATSGARARSRACGTPQ